MSGNRLIMPASAAPALRTQIKKLGHCECCMFFMAVPGQAGRVGLCGFNPPAPLMMGINQSGEPIVNGFYPPVSDASPGCGQYKRASEGEIASRSQGAEPVQ